jgi:hypothetical protein
LQVLHLDMRDHVLDMGLQIGAVVSGMPPL